MHILANISRSKDNQTMKFGQLIEYNRNIFLEMSYIKCGTETIPDPFLKNQDWLYLWINSLNVLYSLLIYTVLMYANLTAIEI